MREIIRLLLQLAAYFLTINQLYVITEKTQATIHDGKCSFLPSSLDYLNFNVLGLQSEL
jgi:hypothetical protein